MTRAALEHALAQMEIAPKLERSVKALEAELRVADEQITRRDTLIARMQIEAGIMRDLATTRQQQRVELERAVSDLERRMKRARRWRIVALAATSAAAVLVIK